jgi:hypothetical protein
MTIIACVTWFLAKRVEFEVGDIGEFGAKEDIWTKRKDGMGLDKIA